MKIYQLSGNSKIQCTMDEKSNTIQLRHKPVKVRIIFRNSLLKKYIYLNKQAEFILSVPKTFPTECLIKCKLFPLQALCGPEGG